MVTIATARVVGEDCFVVDESAKAPSTLGKRVIDRELAPPPDLKPPFLSDR